MALTKDYMLRTRLTYFEKKRLEMLILFLEATTHTKFTKARVFAYLLDKEFEARQMDIINSVAHIKADY
ncbi:MAG: hypothetical protein JXQ67_05195 [Campylobacterales bacterium]|nr:hypothetical protein [Campylobacterales bacterium]